jgi:AcrR family transcriptional regulator
MVSRTRSAESPSTPADRGPAGHKAARTSAKGEDTRRRLVLAARTLLAEDGHGAFTTRNVATLSGVSHGMCHYHFADRTELLLSVIEDVRADWILPYEAAVEGSDYQRAANRVVELLTQPEGDDLARLHAALHWIALSDRKVRAALQAEYVRWQNVFVRLFELLARQSRSTVDVTPAATALAAAADGLAAMDSLGTGVDSRAAIRQLFSALEQSITNVTPGARTAPGS